MPKINPNRRGRTRSGRYVERPLVQRTEDDFPPDSVYWMRRAKGAQHELLKLIGDEAYQEWAEATLSGDLDWRQIYKLANGAYIEFWEEKNLNG